MAETPAAPSTKNGLVTGMSKQGLAKVKDLLDQYKAAIQQALPRHMTADRMSRVAITSVQKNEKLLECAPITLIGAILQLAQLGLEPDDGTGMAYLIPFWNGRKNRMEVQAMPGYRGLVKLARNSGEIKSVIPHAVHAKDSFQWEFGTSPSLRHVPTDEKDPGPITHVYAIANYKDKNMEPDFDVMTVAQVEEIHKKVIEKNKGKDSAVWHDHYDEMAKKTVVRRLCKHLPVSTELQRAVTLDEKADFAIPQDLGKILDPESETSSEAMDTPPAPQRLSEGKKASPTAITAEELKALTDLMEDSGVTLDGLKDYLRDTFKIETPYYIEKADYAKVCDWIRNGPSIPFGS